MWVKDKCELHFFLTYDRGEGKNGTAAQLD